MTPDPLQYCRQRHAASMRGTWRVYRLPRCCHGAQKDDPLPCARNCCVEQLAVKAPDSGDWRNDPIELRSPWVVDADRISVA